MYSTIKKKKCRCGTQNHYPTLGYNGWNIKCAPKEILDKVGTKRQVQKRNRNARLRVSTLLKKDGEATKSSLLLLADKLFGDYIKKRDSDRDGNITCVCCRHQFNLSDKTNDGSSYIVQPLHFVSRSVYSLRFDERQVYAGCCWCNLQMHLHPSGIEFQIYQVKLIAELGVVEVMRMVAQKRVIQKLSVSYLKEVIEKYKPQTES